MAVWQLVQPPMWKISSPRCSSSASGRTAVRRGEQARQRQHAGHAARRDLSSGSASCGTSRGSRRSLPCRAPRRRPASPSRHHPWRLGQLLGQPSAFSAAALNPVWSLSTVGRAALAGCPLPGGNMAGAYSAVSLIAVGVKLDLADQLRVLGQNRLDRGHMVAIGLHRGLSDGDHAGGLGLILCEHGGRHQVSPARRRQSSSCLGAIFHSSRGDRDASARSRPVTIPTTRGPAGAIATSPRRSDKGVRPRDPAR